MRFHRRLLLFAFQRRFLLLVPLAVVACAHLPAAGPGIPLRVMTYNIRSGNGNLAGTADAIRASAPDLVALQEVDVHWADRSSFVDQATTLGQQLGMQVRFARIYQLAGAQPQDPPREFGVALLSKYPVIDWSNHIITRLSTQEPNPEPAPLPGFLEAKIDVAGTPVRVFNTHLDYRSDPKVRQQQVTEMLGYIGAESMPTLLFGDLNAPPDAPEIQPLLARLQDAWPASAGPGLTDPADEPKKRIDYVLVSKQFRVRSESVPVTLASDHRPVVVDLLLVGGS
ncbi:MAG: endonuclease/exonuclease/phosphatase family protein [Gemmatimonadota bacterium]|nr:endonuclease/exonuclease/phosphatase family protein [Gemmatimonadota bacterium]